MADQPEIPLKDPRIAAVLAFLVPGLGHFYQGRIFKGVLYSVCILGTFFTGMALGEWTVVYINWGKRDRLIPQACQMWNGLAFLPAVIQSRRADQIEERHETWTLTEPASGQFIGKLSDVTSEVELGGKLTGHLEIAPTERSWNYTGQFTGELQMDGTSVPIQGKVDGTDIDAKIAPFKNRYMTFNLSGTVAIDGRDVDFHGHVAGGLKRPITDWYAAPLREDEPHARNRGPTAPHLEIANSDLGRYFELGTLYTMIAGLLNVLAIYDAYEGPAYGNGDEEDDDEKPKDDKTTATPAPAETAAK